MKKLLFIVILLFSLDAFAGTITLTCDPNKEECLKGYTLHWGKRPGNYGFSKDFPTSEMGDSQSPTFMVDGLIPSWWFFTLEAYGEIENSDGDMVIIRSDFSNEVNTFVNLAPPKNLKKFFQQVVSFFERIFKRKKLRIKT